MNKLFIILFFLLNYHFALAQEPPLGKKRYANCDVAYDSAVMDVREGRIKYFLDPAGLHGSGKEKDILLDSVLFARYNVRVDRNGSSLGMSTDYSLHCYDDFIHDHMDTAYTEHWFFTSYNIVQRLVGEPEIDFEEQ